MITVVISLNIIIAIFCLFVSWQLWKLRQTFSAVADALLLWEQSTHDTLKDAPEFILQGQSGISFLRQHYGRLQFQLQQVQKILFLLGVGQKIWYQRYRLIARPTKRRPTRVS